MNNKYDPESSDSTDTDNLPINEIIKNPNLATLLTEDKLRDIGSKVKSGYDDDVLSRKEWTATADKILNLVKLAIESKSWPWTGAANIKYPLTTTAVIQYAARTYPEIVRNGKVVGAAVIGKDPDGQKALKAERVAQFMSFQLLIESPTWEEHMDRMLHVYPVVGVAFKKTYYDTVKQRNESLLCMHDEIVVNDNITSLEEALRISHVLHVSKNTIIENMRAGLYVDIDDEELCGLLPESEDYHDLIEQHRYLDLDGDHYEEPYVVTIHKNSGRVLRIVARFDPDGIILNDKNQIVRIKPVQYFTDFHGIPRSDGKYHSLGLGTILLHPNEVINSLLNHLVDAGTLANLQGGLIGHNVEIPGGMSSFQPGEWKRAKCIGGGELKDQVVPITYSPPSDVLLKLLDLMIKASEKLSSVTDIMTGNQDMSNVKTGAAQLSNENGRMVFSSMQRRLYRSLKSEFDKIFRLNRIYLDEVKYYEIMGDQQAVLKEDFDSGAMQVKPVSDPNLSSTSQRLNQAQELMKMIQLPGINIQEIEKRLLAALEVPNPETILKPIEPPPPEPEMLKVQQEGQKQQVQAQLQDKQLSIQQAQVTLQAERDKADIELKRAQAIYQLAQAEAVRHGVTIDEAKVELQALDSQVAQVNEGVKHSIKHRELDIAEASNNRLGEAPSQ